MKPFDPGSVRTLLIRGTNWVGDSILSLPALKRARLEFPHAKITLLVLPWVAGIYEGCTAVDEIWLYDRKGLYRGLSGKLRLIRELRQRQFDAALLFQNAFEAAMLTRLAGIPVRAGYDRDGRGWLLSHKVAVDPRVSSSIRPITTWIFWNSLWEAPAPHRGSNRNPRHSLQLKPCQTLPWP